MKPIIFNTEMVRAILAGRKTETRRVVKFPEGMTGRLPTNANDHLFYPCGIKYPPYKKGDILYVRETWAEWSQGYVYKADGAVSAYPLSFVDKWRPSIHMPKEAARIFLRVKSVRAERLQKSFFEPISPIFAVQSEGIDIGETCRVCIDAYGHPVCVDEMDDDGTTHGECGMLDDARDEFADLWDSTIKPADIPRYGWSANPWVWVIEFEKLTSAPPKEDPDVYS